MAIGSNTVLRVEFITLTPREYGLQVEAEFHIGLEENPEVIRVGVHLKHGDRSLSDLQIEVMRRAQALLEESISRHDAGSK